MWVKVIHRKRVPRVGHPGAVVDLKRRTAKVLIAVGRVAPCDPPTVEVAQEEKPKVTKESTKKVTKKTTKKVTKKKVTKKATYKRRDLRAES